MSESRVVVYATRTCGFCRRARALLTAKGIAYTEYAVDSDVQRRSEMVERSGRTTVPQIFIDGRPIGGCDELHALEHTGELDELLAA